MESTLYKLQIIIYYKIQVYIQIDNILIRL